MNRKLLYKLCHIVSLLLVIAFIIKNVVDYSYYSSALNAAPFYLWIIVNAIFLIIPSIIVFIIGTIIRKRH